MKILVTGANGYLGQGVVKKLLKAKYKNDFENACASEFKQNRAFMFKIGNSTFITPSAMNPNKSIGDHTIECVSKPHILKSGTDLELTAQIVNFASRLYFNEFLIKNLLDTKGSFTRVADAGAALLASSSAAASSSASISASSSLL